MAMSGEATSERLWRAARAGDVKTVEECLKNKDVDVNFVLPDEDENEDMMTPLHTCAENDSHETAAALIKAGADVHARNKYGLTPLHTCAENNGYETAAALIKAGADVHARAGWQERTPLHVCAENNSHETAAALIKAGADVHARVFDEYTSLHMCAENNSHETAAALIKAGADVHARDAECGRTPLHWFAWQNSHETAAALIKAGADVNARDDYGSTVLHECCKHNSLDVARMMLASPNFSQLHAVDDEGKTALDVLRENKRVQPRKPFTFTKQPKSTFFREHLRKDLLHLLKSAAKSKATAKTTTE